MGVPRKGVGRDNSAHFAREQILEKETTSQNLSHGVLARSSERLGYWRSDSGLLLKVTARPTSIS